MSDIFISYARKDQETAQRLADTLEAEGWSVWWDKHLWAGEEWKRVIKRELDAAARCVIVLWSRASIEKTWVQEEAEKGLQRGFSFRSKSRMSSLHSPSAGFTR